MKTLTHFFTTVLVAGTIISCGNKTTPPEVNNPPKQDTVIVKENPPKQEVEYTSYQGVLPCKSCDGITTTLTISSDYQTASLSITHMDNPFVEEGYDYPMNTERGFENDPDATVYILNPDKPVNDQRYFVRSTGNDKEIFEIGKNRKMLKDGKNHTLVKVE